MSLFTVIVIVLSEKLKHDAGVSTCALDSICFHILTKVIEVGTEYYMKSMTILWSWFGAFSVTQRKAEDIILVFILTAEKPELEATYDLELKRFVFGHTVPCEPFGSRLPY